MIRITQLHELPPEAAKAAAQQVAGQIAEEFDMSAEWNGDELLFSRSGVSGKLALLEKEARLEIQLGFLLKAFAVSIEEKIAAKMKKVFAAA